MKYNNIKLRPLMLEDYEMVLNWSKDVNFCFANGWQQNRSEEELSQWWHKCVTNKKEDFIRMGIEINDKLIGYADLACIKGNTAEVGIAIGESKHWGEGIGYHSLVCIMDYASKKLGITVFNAETHETNVRSRKMLEKIGFEEISNIGCEEYLGVKTQLIQYRIYL